MEMPLKRVFNSPQRRLRALPGHHSATIRHLRGHDTGVMAVSGIRVGKGALRGYSGDSNLAKVPLANGISTSRSINFELGFGVCLNGTRHSRR